MSEAINRVTVEDWQKYVTCRGVTRRWFCERIYQPYYNQAHNNKHKG
jgi:hypothetical protein